MERLADWSVVERFGVDLDWKPVGMAFPLLCGGMSLILEALGLRRNAMMACSESLGSLDLLGELGLGRSGQSFAWGYRCRSACYAAHPRLVRFPFLGLQFDTFEISKMPINIS